MTDTFPLVVWSILVVAIAAWGAVLFIVADALRGRRRSPARLRPFPTRVGVTASLLVAGVATAFFVHLVAPRRLTGDDLGIASVVAVPDATLLTDRGEPLAARRFSRAAEAADVPAGYEGRLILAGVTEALSNCHGWVFTGGRYCLSAADVESILRDNAYARVDRPAPRDLIVYRDAQGAPVHTGIVKAVGADGFVLVESKWGQLQVFWHTPDDQRYSERYDYWRSDRPGHLVRMPRS